LQVFLSRFPSSWLLLAHFGTQFHRRNQVSRLPLPYCFVLDTLTGRSQSGQPSFSPVSPLFTCLLLRNPNLRRMETFVIYCEINYSEVQARFEEAGLKIKPRMPMQRTVKLPESS
jgi:hypothetical protein